MSDSFLMCMIKTIDQLSEVKSSNFLRKWSRQNIIEQLSNPKFKDTIQNLFRRAIGIVNDTILGLFNYSDDVRMVACVQNITLLFHLSNEGGIKNSGNTDIGTTDLFSSDHVHAPCDCCGRSNLLSVLIILNIYYYIN